jgi:PTS system sucrose-specific IIC component
MYNVIEAGMISSTGLNTWMPIASAANFAQFGACLAVALKVRNQRTKSVALPSALSASLGITEPAIFGVNFRFMKPFICGMIGGGVGSLVGALFKLGAPVYGVTGIPAIPAVNNVPLYLVELLVSAGVAAVLTWIVWKEDEPAKAGADKAADAQPAYTPEVTAIKCAAGEVLQVGAPGDQVGRVDVDRLEAGEGEGGGHLDVAVHALLAEDGDARARVGVREVGDGLRLEREREGHRREILVDHERNAALRLGNCYGWQ